MDAGIWESVRCLGAFGQGVQQLLMYASEAAIAHDKHMVARAGGSRHGVN